MPIYKRNLDLVKQNSASLVGSYSAKLLDLSPPYHFAAYAFAWTHILITFSFVQISTVLLTSIFNIS